MDFVKILNKKISNLSIEYKLISVDKENNSRMYFVQSDDEIFSKADIRGIIITTDDNDTVERIMVDFKTVMDEDLFLDIVKQYGTPHKMFCKDTLLYENSGSLDGLEFNESDYSLKECGFENKPVCIVWKKDEIKLKFTMAYEPHKMQLIVTKD
ncbi:hypothetical protein ACOKFD_04990 [Flagellimonas sp. S174]|uniref:hypothetical protein n=1 Tax=Flagellimonas sp. S174 TaxID=3410790 RepID=UPI003BF59840